MVKTINEALYYGKEQLDSVNIESSLSDSLILLCYVLDLSKTDIIIRKNDVLSDKDFKAYLSLINKRKARVPVKYLTGVCEFMSLDFYVDKNVLIPRPDTEILVEEVIKDFKDKKDVRILDLCCGSGCIGISLAHYLESSLITMADISDGAINTADKNIKKHNLDNKIKIIKKDILNETIDEKFDIITSNPPYINEEDYKNLEDDVKLYEPEIALVSRDDEYKFYKRIIDCYYNSLKDDGHMYLEMGYNQSEYLYEYAKKTCKYKNINIIKDLSGINRVLHLEK